MNKAEIRDFITSTSHKIQTLDYVVECLCLKWSRVEVHSRTKWKYSCTSECILTPLITTNTHRASLRKFTFARFAATRAPCLPFVWSSFLCSYVQMFAKPTSSGSQIHTIHKTQKEICVLCIKIRKAQAWIATPRLDAASLFPVFLCRLPVADTPPILLSCKSFSCWRNLTVKLQQTLCHDYYLSKQTQTVSSFHICIIVPSTLSSQQPTAQCHEVSHLRYANLLSVCVPVPPRLTDMRTRSRFLRALCCRHSAQARWLPHRYRWELILVVAHANNYLTHLNGEKCGRSSF